MTKNLSYVAEQVRRHDPDRFLCALFAPADQREALLAFYAFALELTHIRGKVREPLMGRIRLEWWREAIGELYAGQARGHPVLQAMAAEGLARNVPQGHLTAMIDAHEALFEEEPFPTGDALLDHARGVGGAAMHSAAWILGGEVAGAAEPGTGVALADFLRLLPQRAAEGRLPLPHDLMGQMGIDPHAMTPVNLERIKIVVSLIAEEALPLLTSCSHPRQMSDLSAEALAKAEANASRDLGPQALANGSRSPIKSGMTPLVDRSVLPAFLPIVLAKRFLERLEKVDYNPFAPELNAPNPWRPIQLARAWAMGKV